MTITASGTEISYAGDGVSTVFTVSFPFDTAADLKVLSTNNASGAVTVLSTGFSVGGGGGSTGTVTFTTAPAVGVTVTILDNPAFTQPADYTPNDAFPAETTETALDRVTRISKRLYQLIQHCLRTDDGDPSDTLEMLLPSVATRKGKYLAFDPTTGAPTLIALSSTVGALSQSIIGALLYPQTTAEGSAGIVPSNYNFIDVRRYGADPLGGVDSTAAFNQALSVNKYVYAPAGTYVLSGTLNLASNQILVGDGPATILQWANASLTNILGSAITGTTVRDLKINVTGSGSVVTSGGVEFYNSTWCAAERVEVTGVNWAGVWLYGSSHCTVRSCYFHNFTGTQQDAADIAVYTNTALAAASNYNIIADNDCFGGGWHGVMLQQASGANYPNYNTVKGNRVGQHATYGVLLYANTGTPDTYNQIHGNYVENIQGATLGGTSGAGIYVAGHGGASIVGNTVKNCCVLTSVLTLAPAGIGLNCNTNQAPFTIVGNTIIDPQHYFGIYAVGGALGGTISGNVVRMTSGTPATGIFLQNCSNVAVNGNHVTITNSLAATTGIYSTANGVACTGISFTGNTVNGTSLNGIRFDMSAAGSHSQVTVTGNTVLGGSAASVGLFVGNVAQAVVQGNNVACTTVAAYTVSASTQVRAANNTFTSTGTSSVVSSGTCTGSYFDKSNYFNALMNNAGTGLIAEFLSAVIPATGTWAVGDRAEMSVPVVGSPKGWRCTVAGTSGTWVSEGNL